MRHELYRVTDLPVLQNRTFADAESAQASASADMLLVQDERSGLIFNAAFDADKLSYDADYQNEQAHSQKPRKACRGSTTSSSSQRIFMRPIWMLSR